MSALRVLVVDDEVPARQRLLDLLAPEPDVDVVAACGSGAEALSALSAAAAAGRPIQLVFLDVQMPEVDGFDVIEEMSDVVAPSPAPAIVFVTAYDQYALRAFDAHAVDYLLKPYSDERFQLALGRATRQARAGDAESVVRRLELLLADVRGTRDAATNPTESLAGAAPSGRHLDRIVLKERGRVRFLPVRDLAWIAAEGVYVRLHTVQRTTHLHRALLGELESSLDPRRFVRIHRSAIVSLDWVEELQPESHGEYAVVLKDRTVLRLSRTYRAAVQALLGQRI
jgi:two-component system LytT family response regulator